MRNLTSLAKSIVSWSKHEKEHPFKATLFINDKYKVRTYADYVANEVAKELKIRTTVREIKASQLCDGRELNVSLFDVLAIETKNSEDVFPQLGLLLITDLEACEKELGRELTQADLNVFYGICRREEHPSVNLVLDNWIVVLTGKSHDKCSVDEKECLEAIVSDIAGYAERNEVDDAAQEEIEIYDAILLSQEPVGDIELCDALGRIEALAEAGNAQAEYILARHNDDRKLLIRSAEHGYADAQYKLGEWYRKPEHNDDVRGNIEEAVKWFKKAAEQGHKEAADGLEYLINQYGIKI